MKFHKLIEKEKIILRRKKSYQFYSTLSNKVKVGQFPVIHWKRTQLPDSLHDITYKVLKELLRHNQKDNQNLCFLPQSSENIESAAAYQARRLDILFKTFRS
ncbi:hypothetical protein CHS0354_040081 [Potamilus streckersoni]|uniref:Uncharacterized protein n=1 Tax=Potamilus streckersoni TaxID=2493646 RepID=A0AAE0W2B5_9BIVA|nr:hypothetical protein CHS0354_040081 [Potamilus streckersoni]